MKLAFQIAAGIVGAALVLWIIQLLFVAATVKVVGDAAQDASAAIQKQSAATQARYQAQLAERQRQAAEARQAQLAAEAARVQAQADAARAEQAESARKSAAWAAFYKPPKKCENPSDWDVQVECGNAHIRAQREFEARWSRGEL